MMAENETIKPRSFAARIDPYAFQQYAKDFFDAYKAYKKHKSGPPFSPARFFLLARSIELAAKGHHQRRGCGKEKLVHAIVSSLGSCVLR
jgi:hypothetical protein